MISTAAPAVVSWLLMRSASCQLVFSLMVLGDLLDELVRLAQVQAGDVRAVRGGRRSCCRRRLARTTLKVLRPCAAARRFASGRGPRLAAAGREELHQRRVDLVGRAAWTKWPGAFEELDVQLRGVPLGAGDQVVVAEREVFLAPQSSRTSSFDRRVAGPRPRRSPLPRTRPGTSRASHSPPRACAARRRRDEALPQGSWRRPSRTCGRTSRPWSAAGLASGRKGTGRRT